MAAFCLSGVISQSVSVMFSIDEVQVNGVCCPCSLKGNIRITQLKYFINTLFIAEIRLLSFVFIIMVFVSILFPAQALKTYLLPVCDVLFLQQRSSFQLYRDVLPQHR